MIESCNRPTYARGLCNPCYMSARVMIASNDTTWPELEAMGIARQSFGKAVTNPFRVAFLAALEKREHRTNATNKKAKTR